MNYVAILTMAMSLPAVHAVAFGGPAPTDLSPDRALNGMTPMPTKGPSVVELRKRQSSFSDPQVCGWEDGDFATGQLSCTATDATCMLYKSASYRMAGCCRSSNLQDCGWRYSCVDYSEYTSSSCGTDCMSDTMVLKCTGLAMPFCKTWSYPAEGVTDFGCDSTSGTVVSVLQSASYSFETTSISLPTVAAGAVEVYESSGNSGSGGYTSGTSRRTKKKLAIGTIIGIVIAVLFLLFFVAIGVFMFIKKKKKQQQLAANAQIVAANRPLSQYQPPPPPQQMQQQGGPPPMPMQSPQPTGNGYFSSPQEQKYNAHTSVSEYAMTPISNPSTPAPQYSQPYGAPQNAPPMPQQQNAQYMYPTNNAHEVAGSPPPQQQQSVSPVQQHASQVPAAPAAHEVEAMNVPQAPGKTGGPVYEIGGR